MFLGLDSCCESDFHLGDIKDCIINSHEYIAQNPSCYISCYIYRIVLKLTQKN